MKGDGAVLFCPAQGWEPQGLVLLGSLFPTCLCLSQTHLEQTGLGVIFVGFASVSKYFVPGIFTLSKTPLARPMHWGLSLLSQDCWCREKGLGGIIAAFEVLKLAPWPAGLSGLLWGVYTAVGLGVLSSPLKLFGKFKFCGRCHRNTSTNVF